ncbi:MAG: hypothetical protein M5U28_28245 [Sandaracinaceae bacterium]|nr:hypothetical protein [Sandaracinaceae bacterium]
MRGIWSAFRSGTSWKSSTCTAPWNGEVNGSCATSFDPSIAR